MAIDLSGSPADVYTQVEQLSKDDFEDLMQEADTRDPIIDSLVNHFASQFKGGDDVEAVIHIKLWDRPGGGYDHREIVISGGSATPSPSPDNDPRLTLKVRPEDLRAIVTGETGPRRLAMRGRLRVLGDLGFGMKLGDYFGI
jgi:putative sterol carrier protein